jgi:hypothetical protein
MHQGSSQTPGEYPLPHWMEEAPAQKEGEGTGVNPVQDRERWPFEDAEDPRMGSPLARMSVTTLN